MHAHTEGSMRSPAPHGSLQTLLDVERRNAELLTAIDVEVAGWLAAAEAEARRIEGDSAQALERELVERREAHARRLAAISADRERGATQERGRLESLSVADRRPLVQAAIARLPGGGDT